MQLTRSLTPQLYTALYLALRLVTRSAVTNIRHNRLNNYYVSIRYLHFVTIKALQTICYSFSNASLSTISYFVYLRGSYVQLRCEPVQPFATTVIGLWVSVKRGEK